MSPSAIAHLRVHRPACLEDLADAKPAVRRSGGKLHATHAVACACGGGSGRVIGHLEGAGPKLLGPISLTCGSCGHLTDLIDAPAETRPRGARKPFGCATCSGTSLFELSAVVSYGDADLDSDEDRDLADRFERVALSGTCGGCTTRYLVADLDRDGRAVPVGPGR